MRTGPPDPGPAPPEPQVAIRLADPDIGDEEVAAVAKVLKSGVLTNGEQLRLFEQEFSAYHQVEHGVGFANGTVALTAILTALDIGPGDEVIVPSLSFISTATSVVHAGALPVFAEIDPVTLNIDPSDVATRITPNTKAIMAVHYGGGPADMHTLASLAQHAGLYLIEDAAEAHGARYRGKPVGGFGKAAMFSFTPTKNITTGEGGMVTTGDPDLADRLKLLRNHGQTALYEHTSLGFNWRLSEIQAAIGRVQLARLDGILARKRRNADTLGLLLDGVDGLRLPSPDPDTEHVFMLYTVQLDQGRDLVLDHLQSAGIEARIYFPPIHLQRIFAGQDISLPVTESAAARILSVPFHSKLTEAELQRVAQELRSAVNRL